MSRRGGTLWYKCSREGCTESGCTDYGSQRERAELARKHAGWLCLWHEHIGETLSTELLSLKHAMVVTSHGGNRYWADEGSAIVASGLQYGPGFYAWAEHFPVGTKLIVMARVELPEEIQELVRPDGVPDA